MDYDLYFPDHLWGKFGRPDKVHSRKPWREVVGTKESKVTGTFALG